MLLTIAGIVFVLWLLGLVAFHVTAWTLHLLLVIAVIAVIVHLFDRRRV